MELWVSVPSRGSGRESYEKLELLLNAEKFPSPRGEVVVKGPSQTAPGLSVTFPSPRGEVVVKAAATCPTKCRAVSTFPSPRGEVVVKGTLQGATPRAGFSG